MDKVRLADRRALESSDFGTFRLPILNEVLLGGWVGGQPIPPPSLTGLRGEVISEATVVAGEALEDGVDFVDRIHGCLVAADLEPRLDLIAVFERAEILVLIERMFLQLANPRPPSFDDGSVGTRHEPC
jgi:hypothetical protein